MERETEQPDDGLVRRSFGLEITSIDEEKRSARFVMSTDSIDSYDEVVEQTWDLRRYQKNPVFLYNHNRGAWGDPQYSLPIGRALDVSVVNGRLEGEFKFGSEKANPFAETCWRCFKERLLVAGSVGFTPGDVRMEKRDGREIYVLSNNELYEFSLTPLPANADAVAKSIGGSRSRDVERFKALAARTAARHNQAPESAERAPMDPEKMKAEIERLTASEKSASERAATTEKEAIELRATNAELQKQLTASLEKVKELQDANDKAEGEAIAAEVNALVGKKITPAQVADYVELRALKGKEKFAEFVSKMPDLAYSQEVTTAPAGTNVNTATGLKSAGANSVLRHAMAAAERARGTSNQ